MNSTRLGARRFKRNPRTSSTSVNTIRKHRPDYMLIVYMTILLVIGAVTVYAISPGLTASEQLGDNYFSYKQLTAIGLGIISFLVASLIPIKTWKSLALPLVFSALIVTLAVRIIGEPVNGAYRWLDVGGISFQAAELIKFALVVWLGGYLAKLRVENRISDQNVLKTLGIVSLIIIVVVAGLQSDLGSAAVMLAVVGFMAFVAGLPLKKVVIAGSIIALLLSLAIIISPYRRERVSTFFNPAADCQNEGYQACQALITVGSGGVFGKGLGRSVQAYGYLPEAANDSIFAIVAEKFGFLGATMMIAVFVALFKRIKNIADTAPNDYSRLLVSGILAWLSIQMIINVGAMLGLLPLKGITLPLVSYGGTSILFVMAAIGLVFQISRYTDFSSSDTSREKTYGVRSAPVGTRMSHSSRQWSNNG